MRWGSSQNVTIVPWWSHNGFWSRMLKRKLAKTKKQKQNKQKKSIDLCWVGAADGEYGHIKVVHFKCNNWPLKTKTRTECYEY